MEVGMPSPISDVENRLEAAESAVRPADRNLHSATLQKCGNVPTDAREHVVKALRDGVKNVEARLRRKVENLPSMRSLEKRREAGGPAFENAEGDPSLLSSVELRRFPYEL